MSIFLDSCTGLVLTGWQTEESARVWPTKYSSAPMMTPRWKKAWAASPMLSATSAEPALENDFSETPLSFLHDKYDFEHDNHDIKCKFGSDTQAIFASLISLQNELPKMFVTALSITCIQQCCKVHRFIRSSQSHHSNPTSTSAENRFNTRPVGFVSLMQQQPVIEKY